MYLLSIFKNAKVYNLDTQINAIQDTYIKPEQSMIKQSSNKNSLQLLYENVKKNSSNNIDNKSQSIKNTDINSINNISLIIEDKKHKIQSIEPNRKYINNTLENSSIKDTYENRIKTSNHIYSTSSKSVCNNEIRVEHIKKTYNKNDYINICKTKIYNNKILIDISNDTNYKILNNSIKQDDVYTKSLLDVISYEFYTADKTDKQKIIQKFKLDVLTVFLKDDLFKIGCFSSKHANKILINDTFVNNKNVSIEMMGVYALVLNINIISISDDKISYINVFDPVKGTIVFIEENEILYTIKHLKDGLIRGVDLEKYLDDINIDNIDKLKLEELQNIMKGLGKSTKKEGKTGLINLKKDELIEQIKLMKY